MLTYPAESLDPFLAPLSLSLAATVARPFWRQSKLHHLLWQQLVVPTAALSLAAEALQMVMDLFCLVLVPQVHSMPPAEHCQNLHVQSLPLLGVLQSECLLLHKGIDVLQAEASRLLLSRTMDLP